MSDFTQLRSDHVELLDICHSLEASLAGDKPSCSVDLFGVRSRVTTRLIAHLKAEDWLLYPRLLQSGDKQIASTAQAFVEDMGGLAKAFNNYVACWNAFRIEREWPQYKSETAAIITALRNRIRREDRELYPLAERLDRAA